MFIKDFPRKARWKTNTLKLRAYRTDACGFSKVPVSVKSIKLISRRYYDTGTNLSGECGEALLVSNDRNGVVVLFPPQPVSFSTWW